MYTLYYSPGACSLAVQVILRELGVEFKLVNKQHVSDFSTVSPVGAVPVLESGSHRLREGAAIILHLLEAHPNTLLPASGDGRTQTIQQLMFANATVHPAYSKLFFLAGALEESPVKTAAMEAAARSVEKLWQVVEQELGERKYLGGNDYSPADILLTVYSSWGQFFPVDIRIPETVERMIERVTSQPVFQAALQAEQAVAA